MDLYLSKYFTRANYLVRLISYGGIFAVLIAVSIFVKAEDNEHNKQYINIQDNFTRGITSYHTDAIFEQTGKASYYGKRFHNRKTASGERFDMNDLTAAHRSLSFGTIIRVINSANDNVTLVRINDRGPFIRGRILDLSQFAAQEIDGLGVPNVKIEGFDRNYLKENTDILKRSYLAYSLNLPLEIIEERHLHFIDSTQNFKEIVDLYNSYSLLDKETHWYICVSAVDESKESIYYLTYPKEGYYFARMIK